MKESASGLVELARPDSGTGQIGFPYVPVPDSVEPARPVFKAGQAGYPSDTLNQLEFYHEYFFGSI